MGAIGPYPLPPADLNLVESLVGPLIDPIRESLHTDMGIRPYRVFVVTETWDGALQGEGNMTSTEIELYPQPKVRAWNDRYQLDLDRCGVNEAGFVRLTEVSLSYTYEQLTGQAVVAGQPQSAGANVKVYYEIRDAQPAISDMPSYRFTLNRPPFRDTEKTLGYIIELRAID